MATVIATIIDSAPSPKISRPAAMTGKSGESAVTSAPSDADGREDKRRQARAEPIDDDAADQHHHDVREAVDGVERADLRVAEAEHRVAASRRPAPIES